MESAYGGFIFGEDRCRAIGLAAATSDCRMMRELDSAYCYYHSKLARGLMEPDAPLYPVWPLPRHGYVLEELPERRMFVA